MKSQLLTILVLTISLSCHKDPPDPGPQLDPLSCNDGTCCGRDKITYEYVEYLSNEPADLGGPPTFSNWGIELNIGVPHGSLYTTKSVPICDLTVDRVQKLKQTGNAPPYMYKYRVWGKVYGLKGIINITSTPILNFYIDSIKVAP